MPLAIEQLIADFGGVARLATLLAEHFPAEPVSRGAIYKWRERGSLPLAQAERLRVLAQRLGRGFELSDYQRGQAASPAPVTALRVLDVSLAQAPAGVHASWLAALDALGLTGVCLGDALGAPRALLAHCHTPPWLEAPAQEMAVWLAAQAFAGRRQGGVRLCLDAHPPDADELRRCLRLLDALGLRAALRLPVRAEWPADWLHALRQATALGADSLTLDDAGLHWVPEQWAETLRRLRARLGSEVCLGARCHNRHGLALANALAALSAGARQLDGALSGEHAAPLPALAATLDIHAARYPVRLSVPAQALARAQALHMH